jgi:3-oxoacyl-(acyl-carrier-protein) synthase
LPEYIFPETTMKTKVHGLAKALAVDCLEDAKMDLKSQSDKDKWRTGCIIANQYGVQDIRHETAGKLRLIKQMPHVVSSVLALDYEIRGHTGSTSGASVGSMMAIGAAYRLIRDNYMDRVLVGGLDFNCNQNVLPGMDAFGALCRDHNDDPKNAAKPFDKNRTGTVLSDGGAMILLESERVANARGAPQIYGEVCGYGQTNDAHHIMKPWDDGVGILAAALGAMQEENLHPSQLDAVNCHARSTVSGDGSEAHCLHALFSCGEAVKNIDEFQALSPE